MFKFFNTKNTPHVIDYSTNRVFIHANFYNKFVTNCYNKSILKRINTLYIHIGKTRIIMTSPLTFNWNTPSYGTTGYNWNNSSLGTWNTPIWGNGFASSTSSAPANETLEQKQAREKKELEEKNAKIKALIEQKNEVLKQQREFEKQVKEESENTKVLEDGTIAKKESPKKMSFLQKLGRGAMNALNGIGNVCKSLVGIDENGKWNPLKGLRNLGIAVGAAALCCIPVAGPIIGTAMLYGGLAMGAGMAIKGGIDTAKALKHDSIEEFDAATQNIGSGLFIGTASAIGLRGASKAAGVASASNGSKLSSITAGAKNILVNPAKGAIRQSRWGIQGWKAAAGNGKGLFGRYNGACKHVRIKKANVARVNYTNRVNEFNNNIQKQVAKLNEEIARTTDPSKKALLEMQRDAIASTRTDLASLNTKTDWKNALDPIKKNMNEVQEYSKPFKGYRKLFGKNEVEINGQKITNGSAVKDAVKATRKSLESSRQEMAKIRKERLNLMRKLAKGSEAQKQQAKDFGFCTNWSATPVNYIQSKYYGFTKPLTKRGWAGKALGAGTIVMGPELVFQGQVKNVAAMPLNGWAAIDPKTEATEYEAIQFQAEDGSIQTQTAEMRNTQYAAARGQFSAALKEIQTQLDKIS